jgi:ABC-2 type transport system ATP-binding protein
LIQITNLTKKFGNKVAVDDVTFKVEKGEILGFLGPNGAGKTTTMNIITGYISYTSGSVTVDGMDILKNPEEAKKRIGYLPENPPLYLDMTVWDYLNFVFDLKTIKLDRNEHLQEVMQTVKILDVKNRLIKNLSKGYRQRVGLAQALLGNPEILILDEPTVGLDPKQINEIRSVIKELGRERTIILSSHILPEVSAICERVIIINNGRIVASDSPENLSNSLAGTTILNVRIEGDKDAVTNVLQSLDNVDSIEVSTYNGSIYNYRIKTKDETDIRRDMFYALAENRMPIMQLSHQNLSLEDVFLKLTTVEPSEEKISASKDSNDAGESNNEDISDSGQDAKAQDSDEGSGDNMEIQEADNQ